MKEKLLKLVQNPELQLALLLLALLLPVIQPAAKAIEVPAF